MNTSGRTDQSLKYLRLLSQQFPTQQAVFTEIINLQAILNLSKGTEHFMSDLHGEYEAFLHILNNCSGVVREHVDEIFAGSLSEEEKGELCTLIYYPHEKLELTRRAHEDTPTWYKTMFDRLLTVTRALSSRYTCSKVRKAIPRDYAYIIDELLHTHPDENNYRVRYHERIIASILETDAGEDFICSLSDLIKRLVIDHLHLVGDIFDRGGGASKIMDRLMSYHSLDIQWGNHDVLWMGAAAGQPACIITVLRNNLRYGNYEILENDYGISLRELVAFADRTYEPVPEGACGLAAKLTPLMKALNVLLFKLEGQIIQRHACFDMHGRLLVIDGGFCSAYHPKTGIAGYTLISSSRGCRLKAHQAFESVDAVLARNADIVSETDRFDVAESRRMVGDTDTGVQIREQIRDLHQLLDAYRTGVLEERR